MYLEKLEMTMGRMEIGEGNSIIVSPLHFEGKWDMYIESE
jgi:hypothetical protein